MAERNYYEVLGVPFDADPKAITKAYRELAKRYHPDLNSGDAAAAERMKEINESYEVLGNAGRRKEYDLIVGASARADAARRSNEIHRTEEENRAKTAGREETARRAKRQRVGLIAITLLVFMGVAAWFFVPKYLIYDEQLVTSDKAVLVAFYNATDGIYWKNNDNWLSDRPLGEW